MKITVVGSGYVGLVSGACLAESGNTVLCLDVNEEKVEKLKKGIIPIYEPGLELLVQRNFEAGRLNFTTDVEEGVSFGDVQFLAVGTPPGEDGSADLNHVIEAARSIGRLMTSHKVVVDKSTVPVGTAELVKSCIQEELNKRQLELEFSVVSNPEFLKEGAAIEDFMRPDRIIIGSDDPFSIETMRKIYKPFQRSHDRMLVMDTRSAELTKYAANAMLATRISFMNELANLAEVLGADIERVRQGIGSDPRIGYSFLYAGCGYGGSCFPKDVKALMKTAMDEDISLRILNAVEEVNHAQKTVLVRKALRHFSGDLSGKVFGVWGLSFKPDTDDIREAPSVDVIKALIAGGAKLKLFDPIATYQMKQVFPEGIDLEYCETLEEAVEGVDGLFILTEWKEFRSPNFTLLKEMMSSSVIFDGRNMYEPSELIRNGFTYYSIGRA